ncbi:MAG: sugar transferase [Lachnospiraceae bacterium]|nr:sugar transferase [Lachnospiraceae bacterium]
MSKRAAVVLVTGFVITDILITYILKKQKEKTTYIIENIEPIPIRKMGFYEKYIKRILDVLCATGTIICFAPLYLVIAVLVKIKLGSPILFTQERPGMIDSNGKETVFKMYKFRSMTDEKDNHGDLLSDEIRITPFGRWLRETSLDELGEVINIINGTMSVIGPRPQLVRDLIFMTKEQRQRHTAKPGLSGLAQVHGRNSISWENKFNWDLKYINNINFFADVKIMLDSIGKALIKREGITMDGMATAQDFGDYLLNSGKISQDEYDKKQKRARIILER